MNKDRTWSLPEIIYTSLVHFWNEKMDLETFMEEERRWVRQA